ncbi:MAG: hypothetical protein GTO71_07840 [Woeseiaceae bacterium]|nr:hypothetical protein [Woeseiaceae bacterium]NIP20999.1 hypothetical protein [Woeseiaceae bacterium]NIS89979.1 hypothetical protein [Woeseiaceae bacterium]
MIEVLGLIAVAVSLIFVGLEVRQNTIASRAAAYQEHGSHLSDQWLALAQDPALSRLYMASEDNWDELTELEKAQLTYVWIASLRSYETILLQVEEGLLDQDAMDRLGWGEAFEPGYQAKMLWPGIAKNLNPHMREHMEAKFPYLSETQDTSGDPAAPDN